MVSETYPITNYHLSPEQHFPLKVGVVSVHFVTKFYGWTEGTTGKVGPTELSAVARTFTSLRESQGFLQVSELHEE